MACQCNPCCVTAIRVVQIVFAVIAWLLAFIPLFGISEDFDTVKATFWQQPDTIGDNEQYINIVGVCRNTILIDKKCQKWSELTVGGNDREDLQDALTAMVFLGFFFIFFFMVSTPCILLAAQKGKATPVMACNAFCGFLGVIFEFVVWVLFLSNFSDDSDCYSCIYGPGIGCAIGSTLCCSVALVLALVGCCVVPQGPAPTAGAAAGGDVQVVAAGGPGKV